MFLANWEPHLVHLWFQAVHNWLPETAIGGPAWGVVLYLPLAKCRTPLGLMQLKIYRLSGLGSAVQFGSVKPGVLFGMVCILHPHPHPASFRCHFRCVVLIRQSVAARFSFSGHKSCSVDNSCRLVAGLFLVAMQPGIADLQVEWLLAFSALGPVVLCVIINEIISCGTAPSAAEIKVEIAIAVSRLLWSRSLWQDGDGYAGCAWTSRGFVACQC